MTVPLVDVSSTLGNSDRSNKRHQRHATASTNKRRQQSSKGKTAITSSDDDDDEADSSNDGQEESHLQDKQSLTGISPAFVGHRVRASPTHSTPRSTASSMAQQLLASTSKRESQYLRPLLVAQE